MAKGRSLSRGVKLVDSLADVRYGRRAENRSHDLPRNALPVRKPLLGARSGRSCLAWIPALHSAATSTRRKQAIAEAEAVTGNAARLVRAPTPCLCKAPGEEGPGGAVTSVRSTGAETIASWAKGAASGAATECDSWRPAAGWSVDRHDRGVCADAV